MKRKFFAAFLSLCMAMSLVPMTALAAETTDYLGGDNCTHAAAIGSTHYDTLQEAVSVGGEITLLKDVTENITIDNNKTVTLNLNGHKITNVSANTATDTIYVALNSTLTINGSGTVDNVSHGKAAIFNNGTVVLNGGSYTRSQENGQSSEASGGNSYYNILNHGNMTINATVSVTQTGHFSSLIENGYYSYSASSNERSGYVSGTNQKNPTLIIAGGTFSGGINTVKNDDGAKLEIQGGTFGNYTQAVVQNHNIATIAGGTFTASNNATGTTYGVDNCGCGAETDIGTLTITGGTFSGATYAVRDRSSQPAQIEISGGSFSSKQVSISKTATSAATISIIGGTFSSDVSMYLAEDYECIPTIPGKEYTVKKLENKLQVNVDKDDFSTGKVTATLQGDYVDDNTEIEGGQNDTSSVENSNVTVDITTTSENSTTEVTLTLTKGVAKSLANNNAKSLTVKTDIGDVTLDQTALDKIGGENLSTPVAITIQKKSPASTDASVAATYSVEVTAGNVALLPEGAQGNGNITISLPLPESLNADALQVWYVKSQNSSKIYVEQLETIPATEGQIAFVTTHLSDFELRTSAPATNTAVASIETNGQINYYTNLNDAIEKVGNSETIHVLRDIPNATGISVPSKKIFTIDFGGHTYTLSGPGAGSTNTETNGFQLLKDSTITFKNGTIRIAKNATNIKRIIQNYANLTLENMHIYAENQVGGEDYALSFNCGSISFKGDTDIITSDKNTIAFDVCYWDAGGYTEGVTVTFDETYTGKINGKIIYDSTDPEKAKLTIDGTGYIGAVDTSKSTTKGTSITVSGGSFGESVAQYVVDTLNYEANNNGTYTYHKTLDEALDVSDTVSSVEAAKDSANAVTVTVKNGNDETKITLKKNDTYKLPTLPNQGYNRFQGWRSSVNGEVYPGGQEVTITADTTFTAVWSYTPPANPNYKITIGDMENGTVTANPTAAKAGATVTLTPVPDEGYALSTLTVTDRFGDAVRVTENSDGTYTFTMPNGQVTVTATFVQVEEPAPTEPFVDVNEGDWFYDAVVYAYQNELMDGVGGNRFAPNSETTRAQLVTILYRLEGEPAVSGDLPFTDVEAGIWYTDAILWAAQNNIVNGVNDTEFAPGDDLTRQQLVTILYRYAESKGYDVSASADLSGYPDAGQVQDYAQPAMAWAVAENIIQGMEDGTLKPAGNASRAQIATILMRFCEDVAQ